LHDLIVYSVNWFHLPMAGVPPIDRFDVHAGQSETAMMLSLHPALVRREALLDFKSSSEQRNVDFPALGNGRSAKFGWAMQDLNPAGAAGNAVAATAEQGGAYVAAAAQQLALVLGELSRLPLATLADDPPRG
jgi:creatinine amidohydrolase